MRKAMSEHQVTLLDLVYHLFLRRKTLIVVVLTSGIVAALFSFVVPKWYSAKVTLLPPSEERSDFGVSSLLKNLPVGGLGLGLGLGTLSDETNLYLALLNSRTVQELVIKKYDLQKRYKVKTMQEALRALSKDMTIEINEDNTISLTVRAKTPYLCNKKDEAEAKTLCTHIANSFIAQMDSVNKVVRSEKARRSRQFIEKRYMQNLNDLAKAEEALRQFQEKYGMIALEEQTKVMISGLAELKALLIAKEIEASVLSLEKSNDHPDARRVQIELNELRKRYNDVKLKNPDFAADKNNNDLYIPFGNIPDIGLQYVRLYREVKIQEMVQEFIYPQYEQAKIQEEKDTATVQILDPAVPPELKTKPKRLIMVAASMIVTFIFFSIFTLYLLQIDYLKRSNPIKYHRINEISTMIKESLFLSRKKNH